MRFQALANVRRILGRFTPQKLAIYTALTVFLILAADLLFMHSSLVSLRGTDVWSGGFWHNLIYALILSGIVSVAIGYVVGQVRAFSIKEEKRRLAAQMDLTRRQEALSHQRQLLRTLIDSLPDMVFYKSREGVYIECNRAFEDFVGRTHVDIVGKRDEDIFEGNRHLPFNRQEETFFKGGRQRTDEVWLTSADGRKALYEMIRVPVVNRNAQVEGYLAVAHDYTHRKEAENALKRHDEVLLGLSMALDILLSAKTEYKDAIFRALRSIAVASAASQAYIFENDTVEPRRSRCTYAWNNTDKQKDLDSIPEMDFNHHKRWYYLFLGNEPVSGYMRTLPSNEATFFYQFGLDENSTILLIPIQIDQRFRGVMALISSSQEHAWAVTGISVFKAAADSFGAAFQRFDADMLLKESEERFRTLTDSAEDAVITLGEEGNIDFWNQGAEKIFGYSTEEILGQNISKLLDNNEGANTLFHKTILSLKNGSENVGRTVEMQAVTKNGSVIFIEASFSGLNLRNEWNAMCIIRDVSGRKLAQEQLRTSQERLYSALEGSEQGIWDWNITEEVIYFDTQWARIHGYTPVELYEPFEKWRKTIHPEDRDYFLECIYNCQDPSVNLPLHVEYRAFNRAGDTIWVMAHGRVIERNKENQALRMLGTIQDITARKKGEKELQNALHETEQAKTSLEVINEQLQDAIARANSMAMMAENANTAKSRFLASMSHEIRTPLNGILGYAQILKRSENMNSREREGLDVIHSSGEHLLTLISDILDISKIEAGRMELDINSFDLVKFIRSIDTMIRIRAREKGLLFLCRPYDFELDKPVGQLPRYVLGDEKRLRQVLINLLGNAIKFTEKGSVTLKIGRVPHKKNHSLIRFQVEDTGVGIPEDEHEIIFEAFQQSEYKHENQMEGTGLGLAISRKLVEMMGGEIELKSNAGNGSVFMFDIKLPAESISSEQPSVALQEIIGIEGVPLSVLIVDDIQENRTMLKEMLVPLGFHVVEADNGKAGLESAEKNPPDIMLVDLVMPVMNGIEMVTTLRARDAFKNTLIMAVSANVSEQQQQSSIQAGCDVFIPKPVKRDTVLHQISTHMGVELIYKDNAVDEKTPSTEIIPPEPAVVRELLNLALMGDLMAVKEEALALIDEKKYEPFAQQLLDYARSFEGAKIRDFLTSFTKKTIS